MVKLWTFCFILVFCLISMSSCTLGPDDKKKKEKKKVEPNKKLKQDVLVDPTNLIKKEIESVSDIINNHENVCSSCFSNKQFEQKLLGYVTPWNSKGYDITKKFANKLDYVSPVWLQIKRSGRKKYELTGTHDIDSDWMQTVRKSSNNFVSILPRILFENFKMEDLHALFNNEEEITALKEMLVKNCNKHKFDGYVFEIYMQLGGQGKNSIAHIVSDIAEALHESNRKLILVIPPPIQKEGDKQSKAVFNLDDFNRLKDKVDAFSLMTYDYSQHNRMIGANAPIEWIEQNIVYFTDESQYRKKILLGLNFYGMIYDLDMNNRLEKQPEPITGSQLIDLLKNNLNAKVLFDDKSSEHIINIIMGKSQRIIFYPTLYSIQERINLANNLGTGLSIWELGQGLDYFYNLL